MASPCETSVCAHGLHDGLHLAGGPRGCRPGILRQQAVTARTRGLVIAQQEEAADLVREAAAYERQNVQHQPLAGSEFFFRNRRAFVAQPQKETRAGMDIAPRGAVPVQYGMAVTGAEIAFAVVVNKAVQVINAARPKADRKSTRLNSSHIQKSRMPSSA